MYIICAGLDLKT